MKAQLAQLTKFGAVGIFNNTFGYLLYLLLTWVWLDPKVAITLLYPIGVLMGYHGHFKYSFSYQGRYSSAVARYLSAHLFGYLVNLFILFLFVDILLYPHTIIQIMAIFVVGGIQFILFKFFVFPQFQPKG